MSFEAGGKYPTFTARLQTIPATVRRYGPLGTLIFYLERGYELAQDARLGVNTQGYASRAQLGYGGEYNEYEPAGYQGLYQAFRSLPLEPGEVFLDYGCGMGRALLVAARQPFRKVLGVELAPQLSERARLNIQRALPRLRCREVEVHTEDATRYEVPPDVSVIFLFNPFKDGPMRAVLERIHASWRAAPRSLRIVFQRGSNGSGLLDSCPWLEKTAEQPVSGARYQLERRHMRLYFYRVRDEV